MPHRMGRDVRQGFIRLMLLVVFPDQPLEHTLITGRRFGETALIEEKEIGVASDIDRGSLASVPHSPFQCLVDLITHGDLPHTIFGLGHINIVSELAVPQKLMVHIDPPILKIQIDRQTAQFGDTEAGSQKDDDLIAILPVDRVAAGEGQEAVLLFLRQRGFLLRIVLQDRVHGEVERVLSDTVILDCRVEGSLQRPFPVVDGLVGIALFIHPDSPFFCVRQLHTVNAPRPQWVLFQNRHQVVPALLRVPLDILPMADLLGVKLADRHLLADSVDPVVKVPLDFLHLLAERDVVTLTRGGPVSRDQFPCVHKLRLSVGIHVFVGVSSVFSLALSSP